jgi:uncharacterized GH25 family protein
VKRIAAVVIAVAAQASIAHAHDFWIEPSTFRPAVGQLVSASLRVGQEFEGDPIPRSAQLIDSFTVREGNKEKEVAGFENRDPAGYVRLEQPGLAIIGYRSKPNPLELDAAKFEEFLKLEGLERIIAIRAQRHETAKPDRERFYRFAKSVLNAELPASATGNRQPATAVRFDQPFGYRFEIIPETNPCASTPLRVRLLYEGKPLAGALVTAMHRDDAGAHLRIRIRSDKSGRVTFDLPKNGVWLIKAVQMVPAPAGANADWESMWASLTFER